MSAPEAACLLYFDDEAAPALRLAQAMYPEHRARLEAAERVRVRESDGLVFARAGAQIPVAQPPAGALPRFDDPVSETLAF